MALQHFGFPRRPHWRCKKSTLTKRVPSRWSPSRWCGSPSICASESTSSKRPRLPCVCRDRHWTIQTKQQPVASENVILAVGAVPKKLSYPHLEEIPVEVALDPEKLAQQPLHGATVAVFGSSHSSMIALPHLLRHPVEKVINFYRSPLKYAVYLDDWILFDDTGLKGRAAVWARENIDGAFPERLERCWVSSPEFEEKLAECDRAVYTVGFERRKLPETPQWGQLEYNQQNGILAPGLFGLGIAFPEYAEDPYGFGQYRVGLQKFMDYLNSVLPLWLVYGP